MGKINSNQKGKRFERQFAEWLRNRYTQFKDARRSRQYCGDPVANSADVVSEGLDTLNLHLECKHVERLNIHEAFSQATKDAGDRVPIVVHTKNREKTLVTLEACDFFDIVTQWYELNKHFRK